ncbi:hypothetical protein [Sphingosinicella rhizophila]|uniref:3-deoxy-7-phosphoheptulonate synthase n=1 Tax=Sphingosinicella rhizophila TaxID=3050082 RepID=A0ABU3Q4J6_9SPHN|nr:hypothetical protein [Sphingosinicella sp. GR2756]MDT9598343.1 hypothetical protein [Sphingosinicella sp. GR2756]
MTKRGGSAILTTAGNDDCHVILRGGAEPNFDERGIAAAEAEAKRADLPCRLMIDASHGNSRKDPANQQDVVSHVAARVADGERRIFGMMIESHLVEGRQDFADPRTLVYGQSITDGCAGWDATVRMLNGLAEAVEARRGLPFLAG